MANRMPSRAQIGKLYIEAMAAAISLAPMQDCVCRIKGRYVYGEELRRELLPLFLDKRMPNSMKEYLLISWIEPKSRTMLSGAGYEIDQVSAILQVIDCDQAGFLISRFQNLNEKIREDHKYAEHTTLPS